MILLETTLGSFGSVVSDGTVMIGLGGAVGIVVEYLNLIIGKSSVKNLIEPKLKWDTNTYTATMERHYDLGLSLSLLDKKLLISTDYKLKKSNSSLHFGLEYSMTEMIPLRFGYDDKQLSFGLGLLLDQLRIDYSLTLPNSDYKDFLENISKINVGISL